MELVGVGCYRWVERGAAHLGCAAGGGAAGGGAAGGGAVGGGGEFLPVLKNNNTGVTRTSASQDCGGFFELGMGNDSGDTL